MSGCSKTVGLARSRCHVCAFFHSREDEYKIVIPFMKEGLDAPFMKEGLDAAVGDGDAK